MKPFSILAFFLLLFFASCEKDVEVKLPVPPQKLVVSCLIYPQNPLTQVAVSLSQPIYNANQSNTYEPVKEASVIISDGINSWTLPYDMTTQTYVIDSVKLKIKTNITYKLSVSSPDGKSVEATTTVPSQNTSFTYAVSINTYGEYVLHGNWKDPSGSADYYRSEVFSRSSHTASGWAYMGTSNVSDEGNPGGTLTSTLYFYSNSDAPEPIYASLLTASPEFYNYFVRRDKIANSGGPFSEPIPMYTNISGGFGVFAGFNMYVVEVAL